MKHVKVLFFNSLFLSATELGLQALSLFFRSYLAQKLGGEGMGLLQLTATIQLFSTALATMGLRFTLTRLAAEELGARRPAGAVRAAGACFGCGAVAGCGAFVILYAAAPWLGNTLLGDGRTVWALRVFALNLPFVSLSAVYNGYFIAVGKPRWAALTQVLEQLVEVAAGLVLLRLALPHGLPYACAAIALSSGIGEVISCVLQEVLYRADAREKLRQGGAHTPKLLRRLLRTAAPAGASALAATGTRAMENLLIPYGLRRSGASENAALSAFGVIHGMVMPLLMFPARLLAPSLELALPELAECHAAGHTRRMNYIVGRIFRIGILFSVCVMWLVRSFSGVLGQLFFRSASASEYLRILASLTPFIYLDLITDVLLKGIGQQMRTMSHDLFTSVTDILLLYFLLPKYAVGGYLAASYFIAVLRFALNFRTLVKKTDLAVDFSNPLKALLSVICATSLTQLVSHWVHLANTPAATLLQIPVIVVFYWVFLRLCGCVCAEDAAWYRSMLR